MLGVGGWIYIENKTDSKIEEAISTALHSVEKQQTLVSDSLNEIGYLKSRTNDELKRAENLLDRLGPHKEELISWLEGKDTLAKLSNLDAELFRIKDIKLLVTFKSNDKQILSKTLFFPGRVELKKDKTELEEELDLQFRYLKHPTYFGGTGGQVLTVTYVPHLPYEILSNLKTIEDLRGIDKYTFVYTGIKKSENELDSEWVSRVKQQREALRRELNKITGLEFITMVNGIVTSKYVLANPVLEWAPLKIEELKKHDMFTGDRVDFKTTNAFKNPVAEYSSNLQEVYDRWNNDQNR